MTCCFLTVKNKCQEEYPHIPITFKCLSKIPSTLVYAPGIKYKIFRETEAPQNNQYAEWFSAWSYLEGIALRLHFS